jgi:hypothetical protein
MAQEVLGGYGVNLDVHPLLGGEVVRVGGAAPSGSVTVSVVTALNVLHEAAAVNPEEFKLPIASDFPVNGLGAGDAAKHHTGRKQKGCKLFHKRVRIKYS